MWRANRWLRGKAVFKQWGVCVDGDSRGCWATHSGFRAASFAFGCRARFFLQQGQ
jgi:hypothetical protein